MAAKVTVSNRQRQVPVDVSRFGRLYEDLRGKVFENLAASLPRHLKRAQVAALAERGTLSVILVSDRVIKKLNMQWMGKNAPTDVLSFPMQIDEPPAKVLPWEIGEIVISVERARAQARQFNHSFRREMAFLFAHGLLHILGFDHIEPRDEKEMFGRQRQILHDAGVTR